MLRRGELAVLFLVGVVIEVALEHILVEWWVRRESRRLHAALAADLAEH